MIDGFGLIAFASLTPIIFVMVFGMIGVTDMEQKLLAHILERRLPMFCPLHYHHCWLPELLVLRRPIAESWGESCLALCMS